MRSRLQFSIALRTLQKLAGGLSDLQHEIVGTVGNYKIASVDDDYLRSFGEKFASFGVHSDIPWLIPKDEIWLPKTANLTALFPDRREKGQFEKTPTEEFKGPQLGLFEPSLIGP